MSSGRSSHAAAPKIAVFGGSRCDRPTRLAAETVGRLLARAGAVVLCGGGGGVMEAAAGGARSEGGLTLGVLPGRDAADSPPNDSIDIALYTGIGQARNLALALSSDAAIAIGGEWGTLSEIALAMKHGRPIVLLASWRLEPPAGSAGERPATATTPEEAVRLALAAASARREGGPGRGSRKGTEESDR